MITFAEKTGLETMIREKEPTVLTWMLERLYLTLSTAVTSGELRDCALLALGKAYISTAVLPVFLKALHFFCPSFQC